MESSSSARFKSRKRQRVVPLSLLRPDLPATFESLNDDTLATTLQFVGNKSYAACAGINKWCKEVYLSSGMTKETYLFGYAPLSVIKDKIEKPYHDPELFVRGVSKGVVFYNRKDVLAWVLQRQDKSVLREICEVAAREGKIDVLDETWNNVNDKEIIFEGMDHFAAWNGKLNVLKWLEDRGLNFEGENCVHEAAGGGHLHIIQWLREEKDLELDGSLYDCTIEYSGQLHILRWLREKEVPWTEFTFHYAAERGNLNILQWLHDEGCPWPNDHDDYLVHERYLKPEVVDWCRANGYRNRIVFRGH